jgi:hypothetical protein
MRHMLMICGDESDHEKSPEEMRNDPEGFSWFEEMDRRGVLRGGNRLRPGSDATTVPWVRGDERGPQRASRGASRGYRYANVRGASWIESDVTGVGPPERSLLTEVSGRAILRTSRARL